jgi:hypothetical protein
MRLRHHWDRVPVHIRKPVVLIAGLALVIAAPFTGVLPGPGGIPIFLIGIAILATEFEWAQRVRDRVLSWVQSTGQAWRRHKILGSAIIVVLGVIFITFSIIAYHTFKNRK